MFGLGWNVQIPTIDFKEVSQFEYKYAADLSYSFAGETGKSSFTVSFRISLPFEYLGLFLNFTAELGSNTEPNVLPLLLFMDSLLLNSLDGERSDSLFVTPLPKVDQPVVLLHDKYKLNVLANLHSNGRDGTTRTWMSARLLMQDRDLGLCTIDRRLAQDGFPRSADVTFSFHGDASIRLSLTRLSKIRKGQPG